MKINTQDITKANYNTNEIRLHSMFYTIQGEGPFTGRPALFVRLHGCNLKCYWCDTEYNDRWEVHTAETLFSEILKTLLDCAPHTIVVLTGGEPMAQPIGNLVWKLADRCITVQLESNGTACPPDFPFENPFVHLILSPKTGKINKNIRQSRVAAWKYVISDKAARCAEDGLPFESTQKPNQGLRLARPPKNIVKHKIYISPLDEQDEECNRENRKLLVELALIHGYSISLQTHKILEVE